VELNSSSASATRQNAAVRRVSMVDPRVADVSAVRHDPRNVPGRFMTATAVVFCTGLVAAGLASGREPAFRRKPRLPKRLSEKPSSEGDGSSHLIFYGPDDEIVIHAVRAAHAALE